MCEQLQYISNHEIKTYEKLLVFAAYIIKESVLNADI